VTRTRCLFVLALLPALGQGCASHLHMTYDYGRAFDQAVTLQTDLTRPSVANSVYPLYGVEAAEIRIRVQEETTDAESGQAQSSSSVSSGSRTR
jgi:hypothetical protein